MLAGNVYNITIEGLALMPLPYLATAALQCHYGAGR